VSSLDVYLNGLIDKEALQYKLGEK